MALLLVTARLVRVATAARDAVGVELALEGQRAAVLLAVAVAVAVAAPRRVVGQGARVGRVVGVVAVLEQLPQQ